MSDKTSHTFPHAHNLPVAYEEALHYLCRPVSKASYPSDLSPLQTLLARLGHPESQFRSVIITGSIGKGTVAHLVAEASRRAGLRTGLFTGPHLYHFRERMAIDGASISVETLVEQVERLKQHMTEDIGRLSTFEMGTALAFNWFAVQGVEFAVLEVGIGGRYDAVNLAPADSAIITPIELEHTTLLGNSLAKIAHHKADVVPAGGVVVSAPQPPEAMQVIKETCRAREATLIDLGEVATWERTNREGFRVSHGDTEIAGKTPLLGNHNALNIATALAWADEAGKRDLPVRAAHVAEVARTLHMPGRMELVERGQTSILIDGAHTPGAARALADTIDSLAIDGPHTYLVAISKDKDVSGFLGALRIREGAGAILTTYRGHRVMPLEDLAELAANIGLDAQAIPDYREALDKALARRGDGGLVVVTGSLFMAAQTREILGLLSKDELAEARLTRSIFTGPEYLALIDSDTREQTTPPTSQQST